MKSCLTFKILKVHHQFEILRIIVYLSFDIIITPIRGVLSYLLYESSFGILETFEIPRNTRVIETSFDLVQIYPTHFELAISDIYIHLYTSTESIINTLILEFVVKKNNIWKKKNLVVTLRLDFYFPFSLAIISKQFFS